MDVFEAIRTILAVRSYQDRPVPEDVLRRIVEAGRRDGEDSATPIHSHQTSMGAGGIKLSHRLSGSRLSPVRYNRLAHNPRDER